MAAKLKIKPRAVGELEVEGLATGETTLGGAALIPGARGLKLLVFVAGAVLMGLELQWLMDPEGFDLVETMDGYVDSLRTRLGPGTGTPEP